MNRRKDGLYECTSCHALYRDILGVGLELLPGLPLAPESHVCKNCGSTLAMPGSRFCHNCGAEIDERSASASTPPQIEEGVARLQEKLRASHGDHAGRIPKTVGVCMVCALPMGATDSLAWCPHCGNAAHWAHFLEWLHVKDHCPMCGEHLEENQLEQHLPRATGSQKRSGTPARARNAKRENGRRKGVIISPAEK